MLPTRKQAEYELEEANKEYASAYNVLQSQNEECRNQQEECISNLNSTNQELAESKISIDSLKSKYGYLNQNCNQMLESYQDSVATLLDDLKKCEESSQNRFSMETEFVLLMSFPIVPPFPSPTAQATRSIGTHS